MSPPLARPVGVGPLAGVFEPQFQVRRARSDGWSLIF